MDNDGDRDSKSLLTIIALIFIGAGAYGLSIDDIGWAPIIIGCGMLAYMSITGKS